MKENKNPALKEKEIDKMIYELFNSTKITQIDNKEESKPVDELKKRWGMNDKLIEMFSDKIKLENNLKKKYAIYLIWILIAQLVLLNLWFVLKGLNYVSFSDSTFNIFITGGIAEVFVLVNTIVKYLFNDNLSELLKILVRTNNTNQVNKANKNTGKK